MKLIASLMAAVVIASFSVQAAPKVQKETIVCKGIGKSKGISLVLEAKSQSNIEGKAIAYYSTLTFKNGVGYTGMIFGYKEDVMLKLKPRSGDNVQVSGTIFMDDSEQTLEVELEHGNIINVNFECN